VLVRTHRFPVHSVLRSAILVGFKHGLRSIELNMIAFPNSPANIYRCNSNFWCGNGTRCQDQGSLGLFFESPGLNLDLNNTHQPAGSTTSISGATTLKIDSPASASSMKTKNIALGVSFGVGVPAIAFLCYVLWRVKRRPAPLVAKNFDDDDSDMDS
jgi:hypothetical protein